MIFIGLAIALALSLLANGLGMPAMVYAASFLPVLILAGPLLYVQLSSLERRREEEDGRRDLPSLADDAGP